MAVPEMTLVAACHGCSRVAKGTELFETPKTFLATAGAIVSLTSGVLA
jgi:hypothetical protein